MEGFVWCLGRNLEHAQVVAQTLGWPLVVGADLPECDVAYVVGLHDGPLFERTSEATAPAATRVIHWVGTDAEMLPGPSLLPVARHLAAPSVAHLLLGKGVRADEVYLPTPSAAERDDPPAEPRIACRVTDRQTLGNRAVRYLQAAMPDVEFDCFGDDTYSADEVGGVLRRASVSVQLDGHDGEHISRMAMEAGRPAIVSYRLPHALTVDPEHFLDLLVEVRGALDPGEAEEAAGYWRSENSSDRFVQRLTELGVIGEEVA